jgi:hypothetical protein
MTNDPLVTIVVTPRERYAVACRNLESLAANTPENHRLVYVAPGAPAAVQQYLRDACAARGYELILRPDYLAPNPSRNLGLAQATTRYVVFIENDVVVEPGWLGALIRCAEEEQADIVSPLCLIGDPADRNVHSFGGVLLTENGAGAARLREQHHCGPICLRTDPRRLSRVASDYSEFHCAMVRRSVFERMGPLDEQILGAAEHIDLALHLRALGCKGFAEPAAVVSYLPQAYTLADLDTYAVRWSDGWHFPTMRHLGAKWNLAADSALFHDYFSSFREIRERCLLREEGPASHSPRGVEHEPEQRGVELRDAEQREPGRRESERLRPAQTIVQLLDQMQALGYPLEAVVGVRDAYGIACELAAGQFRASGRTLLAHLVGTASITAAFGANSAVIAAALLHAGYALGQFPGVFGASTAGRRRWLRRRAGAAVEELVYTYSRLQLDNLAQYVPEDLGRMPIELANAVVIRMANGIEDRIGGDHNYFDSTDWLERSNAQIGYWMPSFTAVADRLGMGAMTAILEDAVRRSEAGNGPLALRPTRPLNYSIGSENGQLKELTAHNLLAEDSPAAFSTNGGGLDVSPAAAALSTSPAAAVGTSPAAAVLGASPAAASSGAARPARRVASIDLELLAALNDGVVSRQPNGVRVVSDPRPWAYSAYLRPQGLDDATGPAEIQIRLHAERGTIGLLLLERGSSAQPLLPEQSVARSAEPVVVRFEIAAIQEAGDLIFRGWPSIDGQAQTLIHSVSVVLE